MPIQNLICIYLPFSCDEKQRVGPLFVFIVIRLFDLRLQIATATQ